MAKEGQFTREASAGHTAAAEKAMIRKEKQCRGCGITYPMRASQVLCRHCTAAGVSHKKKQKRRKASSVWTVSGGLPSLGKRR
jgi:ribosomal protein L40E